MGVFVDTTAFYALADKSDKNHNNAVEYYNLLSAQTVVLLTTNYVVSETYTLIRMRLGHNAAVTAVEGIIESDLLEIVQISESLDAAAFEILRKQSDKDYSFVDAVSFALMKSRGISQAFSFDEHFRQFGFQTLPL